MYKSHGFIIEIWLFIKRHVVICILLLVSLFAIAKSSQIPAPNWLWKPITKLLLCPPDGSVAFEWWGLFSNLSLAYLASIITFMVVQYIPERRRAYKAFTILKKELCSLYSYMSYLISMYLFEIGVEKAEDQITIDDLSSICNVEISDKIKYCRIQHMRNGGKENAQGFEYNLYTDSKKYIDLLHKSIIRIKDAGCSEHLDLDLVDAISSIESNWFAQFFSYLQGPSTRTPGYKKVIFNFDKGFYDFILCHRSLSEYNFDLISYEFTKMSKEEIDAEKERSLFMATRALYKHVDVSMAKRIANSIIALEPTEERLRKSNGVLLEMLVYYDYSDQKQTEILEAALCIAEYILRNETDILGTEVAILNYCQIKKRLGALSSEDRNALHIIISREDINDYIRSGAAILSEDFEIALDSFRKLSEEEKHQFVQFPIYLLWPDPPVEPNPDPMVFIQ